MPRMTTRFTHLLLMVAVSAACAVGVAGCGSSGSDDVVAEVGTVPISRAMLNEWMKAVAGGDYFEHVDGPAPRGLVSDPANYPKCVTAAETIVPRAANGTPAMTARQITNRCHQLYGLLKGQALELLFSIESRVAEGAEQGIKPSNAEVNRLLARVKAEQFPKQGEYQEYLSQREWTPSVETLQLERNIVTAKLEAKYRARGADWEHAFGLALVNGEKRWTARTSCKQGYVVSICKEYKPSGAKATESSSPAILLEELAGH
jgi:hypothetical protein